MAHVTGRYALVCGIATALLTAVGSVVVKSWPVDDSRSRPFVNSAPAAAPAVNAIAISLAPQAGTATQAMNSVTVSGAGATAPEVSTPVDHQGRHGPAPRRFKREEPYVFYADEEVAMPIQTAFGSMTFRFDFHDDGTGGLESVALVSVSGDGARVVDDNGEGIVARPLYAMQSLALRIGRGEYTLRLADGPRRKQAKWVLSRRMDSR